MQEAVEGAILVTGCSGYIGRRLVKHLVDGKHTVVCLYRKRLPETYENAFPVCSDLSSPELLAAPLRGVRAVVHLAWEGTFGSSAVQADNVALLNHLLQASERAKVDRFIFLSVDGAARSSESQFLREKYLAEVDVLNSRIPERIILRSQVVFGGENDRFVKAIAGFMRLPAVYPVPRLKKEISPVHVKDVVETLAAMCTKELRYPFGLFELEGAERYKIDEIFRMVSQYCVKGTRLPVGNVFGDSLADLMERSVGKRQGRVRLKDFLSVGKARSTCTAQEGSEDSTILAEKSLRSVLSTLERPFT